MNYEENPEKSAAEEVTLNADSTNCYYTPIEPDDEKEPILSNPQIMKFAKQLISHFRFLRIIGVLLVITLIQVVITFLSLLSPWLNFLPQLASICTGIYLYRLLMNFVRNDYQEENPVIHFALNRIATMIASTFVAGLIIFLYAIPAIALLIAGTGTLIILKADGIGYLLIFLGIVAMIMPICVAYRYHILYFLAIENQELPILVLVKRSKEMMNGHKAKLFFLILRFFGLIFLVWIGLVALIAISMAMNQTIISVFLIILAILTLMYIIPYYLVTFTKFYTNLRENSTLFENDTELYGNYKLSSGAKFAIIALFIFMLLIPAMTGNVAPSPFAPMMCR